MKDTHSLERLRWYHAFFLKPIGWWRLRKNKIGEFKTLWISSPCCEAAMCTGASVDKDGMIKDIICFECNKTYDAVLLGWKAE